MLPFLVSAKKKKYNETLNALLSYLCGTLFSHMPPSSVVFLSSLKNQITAQHVLQSFGSLPERTALFFVCLAVVCYSPCVRGKSELECPQTCLWEGGLMTRLEREWASVLWEENGGGGGVGGD